MLKEHWILYGKKHCKNIVNRPKYNEPPDQARNGRQEDHLKCSSQTFQCNAGCDGLAQHTKHPWRSEFLWDGQLLKWCLCKFQMPGLTPRRKLGLCCFSVSLAVWCRSLYCSPWLHRETWPSCYKTKQDTLFKAKTAKLSCMSSRYTVHQLSPAMPCRLAQHHPQQYQRPASSHLKYINCKTNSTSTNVFIDKLNLKNIDECHWDGVHDNWQKMWDILVSTVEVSGIRWNVCL